MSAEVEEPVVSTVGSMVGSTIDPQYLQTLVPVNTLTPDHLKTLLRDQQIEMVCAGQRLFEIGEYDNQFVYLLSGQIRLTDQQGNARLLGADEPESRFPLPNYQPRRHRAEALTDCSLMRFNGDLLDAMLAWDQASGYIALEITAQRDLDEDADWMLTLLRSNLFYKVPPMNLREILNRFQPVVLSSGTTVMRQGEEGDCCYVIKEGLVGVYQSRDGRSQPEKVAELGPGRCFGEDALVNNTVRNATIQVLNNAVLMRLDKQDFFLLLKQPPIATVQLARALEQHQHGSQWLDVRTEEEYEAGHFPGALNMPLNLLKLKSRMLDRHRHYLIYCNSGRRSQAAAHFLSQEGFDVNWLAGGIFSHAHSVEQQRLFEVKE